MVALIWFALALVLLSVALGGADVEGLLPAAVAGLGLSLLTAALPTLAAPLQALLFTALTASLLVVLQRWGRRRRAAAIPPGGSSDRGLVISGFQGGQEQGRVRWQGQSWAALHLQPERSLAPGTAVVVMGREGNRLQVLTAESGDEAAG